MRKAKGSVAFLAAAAAAACSSDGPEQVSESGFGAFEVSLAARGDRLTAAWYDTRDGNAEIYVRDLLPHGRSTSRDVRLTTTASDSYEADIVALDRGFAVAWYEKDADERLTAMLGILGDDSTLIYRGSLSESPQDTRNPVLAAGGNELFVAWIERDAGGNEHVWAQWRDGRGMPLGTPLLVAPASASTWNLNAAIDAEGVAYLVFDAESGTRAEEIFVARIDEMSATTQRVTPDDGFSSKYPDIAFAGESVAVTWFDNRFGNNEIFLSVFVDEIRDDFERNAFRITESAADSIGAYLAGSESGFGLAWSDDRKGRYDVYFQAFDHNGRPLSQASRLSSGNLQSLIPAIQPWEAGYAIAWNEVEPGDNGYHDPSTRSEIMLAFVE